MAHGSRDKCFQGFRGRQFVNPESAVRRFQKRRGQDGANLPALARTTLTRWISCRCTCVDETQHHTNLHDFNDLYVLVNFRAGGDQEELADGLRRRCLRQSLGLPPFFPTRLRFEDYIYRLWIQQPGIASAHVDSVQTHIKNNYMRNPLAMDVALNEEICTLLKKKIKGSVTRLEDPTIRFSYNGEVTLRDSQEIFDKIMRRCISRFWTRWLAGLKKYPAAQVLESFCQKTCLRSFYGFEPDFFQQNVTRIVDDVVSVIQASLELWLHPGGNLLSPQRQEGISPATRKKSRDLKSRSG